MDLEHWRRHGWVLVPGALDGDALASLVAAVEDVTGWAGGGGPGLHHWEQTDAGPALARSEDLVPHHDGLRRLVTGPLAAAAGELLGEPAVLFKEKVNHKRPGGAGFAPHQDATAYRFADHHVSCMVPVDPATPASGGLEVVSARHHDGVLANDGGRIDPALVDAMDWQPVTVEPGDVLWFDSYTPHRSGTNTTDRPRRALYLTYNAAAAGDLRAAYYADKSAELAAADGTFGGERVRISVNDDFLGRPVDPVDLLLARYDSPAAQRLYDEAVTEAEHALQCADLAAAAGAPDALVAAALLHDVGHLIGGDPTHEAAGARHLRALFGPEVTAPVAMHVDAKRYLCATDPAYLALLSPASIASLAEQGGPMTVDEAAAFERRTHATDAVRLRRWDDEAKVPGRPTSPLADFEPLLLAQRQRHSG